MDVFRLQNRPLPSALATAFSQTRSAEAYRAWLAAEPKPAAEWLKKVSASTAPGTIAQADAFLAAPSPEKLDALVGIVAHLEAKALGDLQAARASTLGWTTERAPDPPALTGKISIENNTPILSTATGEKFALMNSSFWNHGPDNGHDYHATVGRDLLAFVGRTVTVRGWPDASWDPAKPVNNLLVEDFGLGATTAYTQGRVRVQDDGVFIQLRPDKLVKVEDPALANELKDLDRLGVLLPGAPEEKNGKLSYPKLAGDYWVLGGFAWAQNAVRTGDGKVTFQLQLAHGKAKPIELDATAWDNGPAKSMRQYFFGRFENGTFKAKAYSEPAENWDGPVSTEAPSSRFVSRAVPVEDVAAVEDFGPAASKPVRAWMPTAQPMFQPQGQGYVVNGPVVSAAQGAAKPGHLFGGPYQQLEPGKYRVDFSLRGTTDPTGPFGFIEVYDFKKSDFLARAETNVDKTEGFVRRSLEFTVPPGENSVEFRVWWNGNNSVEAGQIALTKLE